MKLWSYYLPNYQDNGDDATEGAHHPDQLTILYWLQNNVIFFNILALLYVGRARLLITVLLTNR